MLKDNEKERLVETIGDYEIVETHCYPSSYCVRYKGQVDNATCNFFRTVKECRDKIEHRMRRLIQKEEHNKRARPEDHPVIPEADLFYHNWGYEKPVVVYGWQWSTTFGRWSALVTFSDGWHGYTYPKQDTFIERGFPEHAVDDPENGCYSHHCKRCGKEFLAHKHYYNPVCRLCADNGELGYALGLLKKGE